MQIEIPAGHEVYSIQVFEFDTALQCSEAIEMIENYPASGSTGPIVLPNGEQITLDPYTLWFIRQLARVNAFILLFTVIR